MDAVIDAVKMILQCNRTLGSQEESINESITSFILNQILKILRENGVPYGSRTRVAAVKEKRPNVIQRNLAAWIALYRIRRTHGNAYWTLSGLANALGENCVCG